MRHWCLPLCMGGKHHFRIGTVIFSWWWTHGCPQHVEKWNKYIKQNCAPSWTYLRYYTRMYSQQNIKMQWLFLYIVVNRWLFVLHLKNETDRWNPQYLERKPSLCATLSTTTPHGLAWDWTRTSTTRDRRQTAWTKVQSTKFDYDLL